MEDPSPVENVERLGDTMFQISDKTQLLRRVLWINIQLHFHFFRSVLKEKIDWKKGKLKTKKKSIIFCKHSWFLRFMVRLHIFPSFQERYGHNNWTYRTRAIKAAACIFSYPIFTSAAAYITDNLCTKDWPLKKETTFLCTVRAPL